MTATVRIEGVSHHFGQFQALDDINLTIEAGSFAVLLGPSGCGKTTLLSILGGFIMPGDGRVWLDHHDVTAVLPAKRATTTMFQDYALFPHMNLLDNVGFGLRMRGMGKRQRHDKAGDMLELVGLRQDATKKPHELSGGQRQRVALARALAVDPEVLLLDEPLGALDLKLRRQMQDELKSIQRRVGTTFVHVTHDQEEAMAIADTIIVMNAGRVEDQGSPENIYLSPRSLFAAGFMGEANILPAMVESVTSEKIDIRVASRHVALPASAALGAALNAGDQAGLCFRPEHFRLQATATEQVINLGQLTLLDHAFFGTHQRCQMQLMQQVGSGRNSQAPLIVHLPQSIALQNGNAFPLLIEPGSVVILPV